MTSLRRSESHGTEAAAVAARRPPFRIDAGLPAIRLMPRWLACLSPTSPHSGGDACRLGQY